SLLDIGSENLRLVLLILEKYSIFEQDIVLNNFGEKLFNKFDEMITNDLIPQVNSSIMKLLDSFLIIHREKMFHLVSTLLPKMINQILDKNHENPILKVQYLNIIARISLIDPSILLRGFQNVFYALLDVWLDKFDNIVNPKHRKLHALCFCRFLYLNELLILDKFPLFINCFVDVLSEGDKTIPKIAASVEYLDDLAANYDADLQRSESVAALDPVMNNHLPSALKDCMI
ncbi:hypothetical protein O9G_006309, partial [Rozella allomycis CSF55]